MPREISIGGKSNLRDHFNSIVRNARPAGIAHKVELRLE